MRTVRADVARPALRCQLRHSSAASAGFALRAVARSRKAGGLGLQQRLPHELVNTRPHLCRRMLECLLILIHARCS